MEESFELEQTEFKIIKNETLDDDDNDEEIDDESKPLNTAKDLSKDKYEPYKEFKNHEFKCIYCTDTYSTRKDYVTHVVDDHEQTEDIPFPCNLCPETFYVLTKFRRHLRWHGPPSFECEKCERKFHSKVELNRHMKEHMGKWS